MAPERRKAHRPPSTWPVQRVESAGGVVVRTGPRGPEVVLIRRLTADGSSVWTIPKGHLEQGESPEEAARREVQEETGLEAEVAEALGPIRYWYAWPPNRTRYHKTVHVFLMRVKGGDPSRHDSEAEEVGFFAFDEAARVASYPSERRAIRQAAELVRRW